MMMDKCGDIWGVVDDLALPDEIELSPEAVDYFGHFQSRQDLGYTWGDARNFADMSYKI